MKAKDIEKISIEFNISIDRIKAALDKAEQNMRSSEIEYQQTSQSNGSESDGKEFYFLKDDFTQLVNKISRLHLEVVRLGEAIGRSCDVSGETFHDNFDYEECSRQQMMWSEEIKKLNMIKRRSRVTHPGNIGEPTVSIGRTVEIKKDEQTLTLKIGSYMTFSNESVSYASPLVQIIFGAKEGEERVGEIMGLKTKIRILSIK